MVFDDLADLDDFVVLAGLPDFAEVPDLLGLPLTPDSFLEGLGVALDLGVEPW